MSQGPREVMLGAIWEAIRAWGPQAVTDVPAARRAAAAGAESEDLVALMRLVAYETAFGMLELVDARGLERDPAGAQGWALVEAVERRSGRLKIGGASEFAGLHQDLLIADPTGQEGADFLA